MRIIHFHPDARMAVRFIAPLMDAERGEGYKSELVCSDRGLGLKFAIIPFSLSVSNLLGLPFALWRIWKYLKRFHTDVVFSHNTVSSLLPLLGAWLAGVHVRVYYNHGVPYIGYHSFTRFLLRTLERWNGALATHVVTVSRDMQWLLNDVSPRINPKIIHNGSASGIDLHAFSPERHGRSAWRQAHGLQEEDLVVVYVGRPERRKGFVLVLRLWVDHLRDASVKLVLCGPGLSDVKKYLSYVPSNVISLGFIDNIPEVLLSSNLLILPSLHEGLSYACLEAQAAGTVVIANDIVGIRCVIEDGVTGFLVPKNDPVKFAEIILKIHKKITSTEGIRRQAIKSVGRFSREHFMPAYLSFLSGLLPEKVSISDDEGLRRAAEGFRQ